MPNEKFPVAEQFRALGDPTRLAIVEMLAGKELCVCDIIAAFQVSQPTISHHLKVLKQAGLVLDNREGKWIYYRLDEMVLAATARFFEPTLTGASVRMRTCKEED